MTAEGKAKELWLTYYELLPDGIYSDHAAKAEAKKFALIAVDMVLFEADEKNYTMGRGILNDKEYWEQVRNHLQNL